MKNKILNLIAVTIISTSLLTSCGNVTNSSLTTKQEFKVYGNCGMCKKAIEGSLDDVDGIASANWNKNSKMMEVSFDSSKMSLDEIKAKIADVGYDSETHRATEEAYSGLHSCCQYERPE